MYESISQALCFSLIGEGLLVQARGFNLVSDGLLVQARGFNLVSDGLLVQPLGLILQLALAVRKRIAHAQQFFLGWLTHHNGIFPFAWIGPAFIQRNTDHVSIIGFDALALRVLTHVRAAMSPSKVFFGNQFQSILLEGRPDDLPCVIRMLRFSAV